MIGIDLGTTNSLVSVLTDGKPVVLANELGETLTPSAVAVSADGAILVGRAARDRLINAPESGRAFFKRDMGTSQTYRFGGKTWSPVECSARILQEMKRIAELRLGQPVTEAVVTVPAYFHDQQRQATVAAARIAGLKVQRLVNEPTAAALAYGFQNTEDDPTLLVFDLGGGTFDVTLLEIFDGVVEVKASCGESRLGGEDYTEALAEWLAKETKWQITPAEAGKWRQQVEHVKRSLTTEATAVLEWQGKSFPISREDFKAATVALSARLWPVIRRCLRDAGVTPHHLTAVLMVGGASRMPMVLEGVEEILNRPPQMDLDLDRVVALGAAVQQALCSDDEAVKDLVLTDVCPHSLGVMVVKQMAPGMSEAGFFEPIIDRNTAVPVSRCKQFNTLHPTQDEIRLQVYQGESRKVDDNLKTGELRVTGLKHESGQRNPGEIEVRFTYDMSGLLEVEVTNRATGAKTSKVFENQPGMMTEREITEAIARLTPLKTHPRDLPPHRARLERANRLFAELTGEMRQSLNLLIDDFESALTRQDADAIRHSGDALDAFLRPFFRLESEPPEELGPPPF